MRVGGIRIIFQYASQLQTKNHDVIIYCSLKQYKFKTDNSFKYFLQRQYWIVKSYFLSKDALKMFDVSGLNIKFIPWISDLWIDDADAIIASEWVTALQIINLNESKGRKIYFIQGHETFYADKKSVEKAMKSPLKKIVISKYLSDTLISNYNQPSVIIKNGIDFDFFNNDQKQFNNRIKQISFIESRAPVKQVPVIISVLKKIINNFPDLRIVAFGEDIYNKLPEFVNFIKQPSDNQIRDIYRSSDIFIGYSRDEGFYLAPAEAMACKCAVITTKVGAVQEFSKHMESAIHVSSDNQDELYNSIELLIRDDELLKNISINGYKAVRESLDWSKSLDLFEAALLEN